MISKHKIQRAWERTRTVPGLGRDVTALVALFALGTFTTSVVLINQRYDWPWQEKFEFQADFAETPGISPSNGQEVRIAGVTVGSITEAEVTDNGLARLTLSLEPGHTVYKDTQLVLRAKTPLNDMYVEMSQGSQDAGKLEEGDVIALEQTASPVQVDRVVQNLDEDARSGLASILQETDVALANAPKHLGPGLDATDDVLADLQPVVDALDGRRKQIRLLVSALSKVAGATGGDEARLARITTSLADTLSVISARDDELTRSLATLPGFVSELKGATGNVTRLSQQLDPTLEAVKGASETLPTALARLAKLAETLDETAQVATPVAREARPVLADLRPVIPRYDAALEEAAVVTPRLDYLTKMVADYRQDISAFVYNTTSIFSLGDANGGILRGQASVSAESLPFVVGKVD
ncbi:MlaD family protein [Nocardioides sp. Root190]|uniref:MlaD family protein n=1 Tax=Nocardioides sp. Root190 TaxID=1736488 RepID=UPI0009E9B6A1|nr:MlaD family protein [Nocardioides sp. Root190]